MQINDYDQNGLIPRFHIHKNEGTVYLVCNDKKAFFISCKNVCDALSYLLDNVYIRFGQKLYRQIVGIPMVQIVLLL